MNEPWSPNSLKNPGKVTRFVASRFQQKKSLWVVEKLVSFATNGQNWREAMESKGFS